MNTIDILDNDELLLFIDSLRLAGYDIGTTEFFAVQDLLMALAKQGKLPAELSAMRTLLMPILCHSPKEQEDFGRYFDDWVDRVAKVEPEEIQATNSVWLDIKSAVKNLKWFLVFALLVFVLIFVVEEPIESPEQTTETPSEQVTNDSTDFGNLPIEPTDIKDSNQYSWQWLVLLLLPFGLWYLWQRYKAQFYLTRKATSQPPKNIKHFFAKNINEGIFQSAGLARTAQQLRKHKPIATDLLDLKATVKRTIRAGGWLTPVTGIAQAVPEYLVLIDRTTFKDHQSHLVDALVKQLVAQGVFVTRYYFDGDPRHCYPVNDDLPPLLLTELADRYSDHRLLIFSDGKEFIDPISGDIVSWIEQFSVWTQRVFFTLEHGYREQLLTEADFLVMPANEHGLAVLAELINAGKWRSSDSTDFSKFPVCFNDFSQWWLERHAPDNSEINELLAQVRDFLGEDGCYWLGACAVYPELRWQLTLYLGHNLEDSNENKLLNEERFAKLVRLPWFRYGYMPNWLRERLVSDLSLEQEKAVRTALNILWAKVSEEPISDFCLEVTQEQKENLSKSGKQLLSKWVKDGSLRDYVFLSFVGDRLAVKIPKTSRSVFGKFRGDTKIKNMNATYPNQVHKLIYQRLQTFYRNKMDLAITFGQAPLLGIAFFFLFQYIVTIGEVSFFPPLREYLTPNTASIIIFLAVLTSVWFGSSKAIVEIQADKILHQQEYLSFLNNFNYLLSIFISLSIIVFIQVLLFAITFHSLFIFLPAWFQPYDTGLLTEVYKFESVTLLTAFMPKLFIQFMLLLWLTAIAAIAVAMFVSMFMPSRSAANTILPYILIVQILFAGSIISPVIYMTPTIQTVANLTVSRWGFEAALLLFERDLNILMPRYANDDTNFAPFSFNYGLRKLDTRGYVAQVAVKNVKILNNNPETAKIWRDSLQEASEKLKYLSEDISEVENQYINKLGAVQWDIEKLAELTIPPRLLEDAKKQFHYKYSHFLETLISKVDEGKILTEYSIWQDMVRADPNLKLFRRITLYPIAQADLSWQERNIWSEQIKISSSLQFFRPMINLQTPCIMLVILTIGMLILGWIYFNFKIR
ncbi:ABC transporter permease [Candidatus Halobeggiatoa sp. HSG11]|nr:ABC transporter permease [Candidatus Halobeggiatoa sp. HSG11]